MHTAIYHISEHHIFTLTSPLTWSVMKPTKKEYMKETDTIQSHFIAILWMQSNYNNAILSIHCYSYEVKEWTNERKNEWKKNVNEMKRELYNMKRNEEKPFEYDNKSNQCGECGKCGKCGFSSYINSISVW